MNNIVTIPVISETLYSATYWYVDTYLGLQEAALQKGLKLIDYHMNAEDVFPEDIISNPESPVLLLGTSTAWIETITAKAQQYNLRTLVIGSSLRSRGRGVSSIYLDYYSAMNDAVYYLKKCGRERIALVGINPASATDIEKADGYRGALRRFSANVPPDSIFYNNGSLEENIGCFIKKSARFDAVICSNDIAALELLQNIKKNGRFSPESLFIIGFGGTLLGELVSPSLTTVILNYRDVGKQAVSMWKDLMQTPTTLAIACAVECKIIPRETTLFRSVEPAGIGNQEDFSSAVQDNLFYRDLSVRETLQIEELLSQMDLVDCCVLLGILKGMTYESLAEQLNISDGTVKYRLKKMIKTAGVKTKEELFNHMDRRVGLHVLEKLKNIKNQNSNRI